MPETKLQTFANLARHIRNLEHPTIVAIDGRAGSGKTTFANKLAAALQASVVHTDDISWFHSFFDWWQLAVNHVLEPFRAGESIDWIPEAYKARGRKGSILVPRAPILIFEGVSASRLELSHLIDIPIWIETPINIAEQRTLERDGLDELEFQLEWQAEEKPLLAKDQPWTRAKLIVDGKPTLEHDPNTEFVSIVDALA